MPLAKYKVGDLITHAAALKVLMILESPHINEYIHAHPAAGESALALTQLLSAQGYLASFDSNVPIGCNIKALVYTPLGILNCSHLPMNPDFYPCTLSHDAQAKVDSLTALKQHLAQNSQEDGQEAGQEQGQKIVQTALADTLVFQDFSRRLSAVLTQAPDVLIVPCGHTARGFMSAFAAAYDKPLQVVAGLPHPTEPEWQNVHSMDLHAIIDPLMLP